MNWITYTKDTPPPDWSIVAVRYYLEGWGDWNKIVDEKLYYTEDGMWWVYREASDDQTELISIPYEGRIKWDYMVLDCETVD